jgi:AraC-like DNA-binding protein
MMTKNTIYKTNLARIADTFGPRPDPHDPWPVSEIEAVPRDVVIRAQECPSGYAIAPHHHGRHQLVYAHRGVMTVTTATGIWVVPPQRAVWVPTNIPHEVAARDPVSMRNVYIRPEAAAGLPEGCCVVTVSPLLRELILQAAALPRLYDEAGPDGRMMAVILDQIRAAPVAPLELPWPANPRLAPIVETLKENPGDPRSLGDWAAVAGASARTLARLFVRETGMTFGQWRQQARLLEALARLATGQPAAMVAFDLGYGSQSAFIAMFRKALGKTPGKYFAE